MELQTISQVSKTFHVSPRTLRYYDQIGLLPSQKKEGYAYRVYDENALQQLQKIILLRKLRIPLKQIGGILQNEDALAAIEIFRCSINEIDSEMDALSTIKTVLLSLIEHLNRNISAKINLSLLEDQSVLKIIDGLEMKKTALKEGKSMEDLNQAEKTINKLTDRDVRIVYLPPATVAAYQYIGDDPELHAGAVIDAFVRKNNLTSSYPALRHYGFNSPNPADETNHHGYEMWVSIPAGMDVPAPLIKKQFSGGLYAAYMIPMGAFEQWELLSSWVCNNNKYEYRGNWDPHNMFGFLEEHLNYIGHANLPNTEPEQMQLDLLIPVQEKE